MAYIRNSDCIEKRLSTFFPFFVRKLMKIRVHKTAKTHSFEVHFFKYMLSHNNYLKVSPHDFAFSVYPLTFSP